MALRIACDLDGTLADLGAALQREAELQFGLEVNLRAQDRNSLKPSVENVENEHGEGLRRDVGGADRKTPAVFTEGSTPLTTSKILTANTVRRLWANISEIENFWTSLPEVEPGAVARLASLTSLYGWEVIFLTQRTATAGETTQVQSQRWLETHGFELPSVYVVSGLRGRIAAGCCFSR
jgi:hypothetical protein